MAMLILGFGLLVGLVLLAAYLGYRGSDSIQETGHALVREHLLSTTREVDLERQIEIQSQQMLDQLVWILGACFVLAVSTAAFMIWLTHRAFQRMEAQAGQLAKVSWRIVDDHERLARQFSHEMHDELGQTLTGLRGMLARGNDPAHCVAVVDEVLQEVRKLAQVMRPVVLDDFGVTSALSWLTERFRQRTGIGMIFRSDYSGRMADRMETHLFRIGQEALANIGLHSGASAGEMTLSVEDGFVRLVVMDNGRGMNGEEGLGMVGMRARARQMGGEMFLHNRPSGGLCIAVSVPIELPKESLRL